MDGYNRRFNVAGSPAVQLGFFKEGQPMGKYQSFTEDGKVSQEGIKEGNNLIKSIPIANYLTRVIKQGKDVVVGAKNLSSSEIQKLKA